MSQAFVVANFDPRSTAYWLSPSARLAASKIVTQPFWALLYWYPGYEGISAPRLSAISSAPAPSDCPGASFLLGPKYAVDSGMLWFDPGALVVQPPLPSTHAELCRPVYLHCTPTLKTLDDVSVSRTPPYLLDPAGLDVFRNVARENQAVAYSRAEARREAGSAGSDGVVYHEEDRLAFVLGQLSNPRAYAFDYDFEYTTAPVFQHVATIYEEIYQYIQLCKDYRWRGVEDTIAWARGMRASRLPGRTRRPQSLPRLPRFSALLRNDARFRAEAQVTWSLMFMPRFWTESGDIPEDKTGCSDISTSTYLLPFAFPDAPQWYPLIELGRPRIVVFDVFSVLLDREAAIREALCSWLPDEWQKRGNVEDAVKLYIEAEALANRTRGDSARSVAELVQAALCTLRDTLHLQPDPFSTPHEGSRSPDAAAADAAAIGTILRPKAFAEVDRAAELLVSRGGCVLICIPPHSATTMDALRPALPPALRRYAATASVAASLHFPYTPSLFDALTSQCETLVPGVRTEEVLMVSGGVGRVISPALVRGHATALVRRPESIEGNVKFVISQKREKNPVASIRAGDLMKLCVGLGLA
ncbi:hypothetical protein OH77DRAFT_1511297 [Trametes cingulata]|nr:hypothetical protein OH77DRAFT_1511297 [Trametes cingulata]